mmetsp:Transcript_75328/g.156935  ORF Transcript_75328/g.156935 Transcript_75328/m.156935 type:complete len:270 (+) Transcript_75328:644-1453(+)
MPWIPCIVLLARETEFQAPHLRDINLGFDSIQQLVQVVLVVCRLRAFEEPLYCGGNISPREADGQLLKPSIPEPSNHGLTTSLAGRHQKKWPLVDPKALPDDGPPHELQISSRQTIVQESHNGPGRTSCEDFVKNQPQLSAIEVVVGAVPSPPCLLGTLRGDKVVHLLLCCFIGKMREPLGRLACVCSWMLVAMRVNAENDCTVAVGWNNTLAACTVRGLSQQNRPHCGGVDCLKVVVCSAFIQEPLASCLGQSDMLSIPFGWNASCCS